MTNIPITLRPAVDSDLSFFFSSTLQSYFYSSPTIRGLLPSVYYPAHKALLYKLLARSKLEMACSAEDLNIILGFALTEGLDVHYMYVKRAFRRFGIARELLRNIGYSFQASHWTDDLNAIARHKPGIVFNPYLLTEK